MRVLLRSMAPTVVLPTCKAAKSCSGFGLPKDLRLDVRDFLVWWALDRRSAGGVSTCSNHMTPVLLVYEVMLGGSSLIYLRLRPYTYPGPVPVRAGVRLKAAV
jgi:hypothetical protein